jgi:predicted RNase H-like HicB family nuclease
MDYKKKSNYSKRKPSPNRLQNKEKSMNALVENRLIGTKEFRSNLSDCLNQVIHKKKTLLVGNQFRPTETATVIATDTLEAIASHFVFTSTVHYDEETKQYVASVEQFNADGVGGSAEEAIEMALDNIEIAIESFFEKAEVFLKFKKYADLYPYYLRAALAGSRDRLAQILSFK